MREIPSAGRSAPLPKLVTEIENHFYRLITDSFGLGEKRLKSTCSNVLAFGIIISGIPELYAGESLLATPIRI